MRQFKLTNALGQELDLTRRDMFLGDVDGLGESKDISNVRVGGFFVETDVKLGATNPKGNMYFKGYKQYDEFVSFCMHAPLTLAYLSHDGGTWKYLKCRLQNISKGEKASAFLICAVDFCRLSPWCATATLRKTNPTGAKVGCYPLTYPYCYASGSTGTLLLHNEYLTDAPLKMVIYGQVINPHWTLMHRGNEIASGAVNITIPDGSRMLVCSIPGEEDISMYDGGGNRTDIYELSDFSTERFMYAPYGDSYIYFSHDGAAALDVIVEVYPIVE